MLTLLSTIFGLLGGVLPNIVKIFEARTNHQYELELAKLRFDAAREGIEFQSLVDEGKSLRDHDVSINADGMFEPLRASIRPIITYLFFIVFVLVKIMVATFMFNKDYNAIAIANAVLDEYTMAIFGSVIGFWFGSRAISKMHADMIANKTQIINIPKKFIRKEEKSG